MLEHLEEYFLSSFNPLNVNSELLYRGSFQIE